MPRLGERAVRFAPPHSVGRDWDRRQDAWEGLERPRTALGILPTPAQETRQRSNLSGTCNRRSGCAELSIGAGDRGRICPIEWRLHSGRGFWSRELTRFHPTSARRACQSRRGGRFNRIGVAPCLIVPWLHLSWRRWAARSHCTPHTQTSPQARRPAGTTRDEGRGGRQDLPARRPRRLPAGAVPAAARPSTSPS